MNKNTCQFCKPLTLGMNYYDYSIRAKILGNSLLIFKEYKNFITKGTTSKLKLDMPVNYCPMCGRRIVYGEGCRRYDLDN